MLSILALNDSLHRTRGDSDFSILNVALPRIGSDVGFAIADLQWISTAFAVCGLFLPEVGVGESAADEQHA